MSYPESRGGQLGEQSPIENREPTENSEDSFEKRSGFRVSIFGTASDQDIESMNIAANVAEALTERGGFKIATGGQQHGTMRAAAERAHEIAQRLNRPDLEPAGIAMERWQPLEIGEVEIVETLQERLKKLIDGSEASVSVTGGIGTFVETIDALHGTNIEKGREGYKKPVIILDPTLKLVQMMRYIEQTYGAFASNPELEDHVFVINNPEHARVIAEIFYKKKTGSPISEEEENFLRIYSIKDHLESATKPMELEVEEGIEEATRLISERMADSEGPVIVAVAGGSASGKSSIVASRLKESFGSDAVVISMDDYVRGQTFMDTAKQEGRDLVWDQPEAVNIEALTAHLQQLRQGETIQKPIFDMKTNEPSGQEDVAPKKVIIVEGLFALEEPLQKISDVKIFVHAETHARLSRRLLRDMARTSMKPEEIVAYFSKVVVPMHEKYIEPQKQTADIIIRNTNEL